MPVTKKIKLYPINKETKELDKSKILYPETSVEAVNGLDDVLNTKQDTLNQNQLDAVNSGITANKVAQYDAYETSKQDTITPENPIDANCVEGLEEELVDFVKKETLIGGVSLEEDTENLQDYKYDKQVEIIKGFEKGKTYYLKSSFTEEETNNFYSQIDSNGSAASYQIYYSNIKKFSNYVNNNNKICIGLWRNDDISASILYDYERETWVDINQRDDQGLYVPIPYDKQNPIFQFVFDVNGEFSYPDEEPYKKYDLYLLRQLLVNEDDSQIEDITREYDVLLKNNLDDYKNWKYGQKSEYKYTLKQDINWEEIKNLYDPNNYKFYEYYDGQTTRSMYIYTVDKNNITYYYIQIYNYYDWQSYYIFEEDGGYNNKDYVKKDIWYSFYNYYIHVEMPQEVKINENGIKNQEMFDLIFDKVPVYETLSEKIDGIDNQIEEIKEDLNNGLKDNLYENLEKTYHFYESVYSENKVVIRNKKVNSDKITQLLDDTYYSYDRERSDYACELLTSDRCKIYYVNNSSGSWTIRYNSYIYLLIDEDIYSLEIKSSSSYSSNMLWRKFDKTINTWVIVDNFEIDPSIFNNYWNYGLNPNWSNIEDFEYSSFYEIAENEPYTLLETKPDNWDYAWNMYYYKDGDDYYRLSERYTPNFEENTYYYQNYNQLHQQPQDWEENYSNYYCDSFAFDLLNEILEKVEFIPQSLEEKFNEIEEEIESHTDDSYLKDRIYGMSNNVILVDGNEYSLNNNYNDFFNKYSASVSTTQIYNEFANNSGELIDNGGEITPGGLTRNATINTSKKELDVASDEEEYVKVIVFFNEISPTPSPTPAPTPIKVNGLPGASYLQINSSYEKTYGYYVNTNSWVNLDTQEEVDIKDMPKIKLSMSAILNEEMFKEIVGGNEITLEEKFNESIKNWNYDFISGESGVKPIFDNANIIMDNGETFYNAGLTSEQENTTLYGYNDFVISYTFSQGNMTIKYLKPNFESQMVDIYTNYLSFSSKGIISEWTVHTEPFNSEAGVIYSETPITSQEELPFITNYNEENITSSDYVPVINLLIKAFSEGKKITLEEKINDFPNWTYSYQKESYALLDIPNWEGMGETLEGWSQIYTYEHSDSGFSDSIYIGELTGNHPGIAFDIVYEDTGKKYEIYNEDWVDSSADDFEVKANTYYRVEYVYQPSYTKSYIEEKPELEIHKEAIKDQDLFNCVYQYTPEQKQTLDEKINEDLKDKTYGTKIDETKKAFKTSINLNAFEDLENGMNLIYGVDENTPEFPIISVSKATSSGNTLYIITYTLYTDLEDPSKQIAYGYTNSSAGSVKPNVWNYIDTTGEEPIIREEVPQPFVYDSEKIKDLTHFNFICEDIVIKQTLEDKLNEIETLAITSEINVNDWEQTVNPIIASTYPYQATIQNDNLIKSIKCEVEFGLNEMLSENYAPYYECDNETGELIIFAKQTPQSNINIKIIRWLGKTIINS